MSGLWVQLWVWQLDGVSAFTHRHSQHLAHSFFALPFYPHNSNPRPANAAARLRQELAATTITRLARPVDDPKAASALSLDLASRIVTVLDCGIEDLLEVIEI